MRRGCPGRANVGVTRIETESHSQRSRREGLELMVNAMRLWRSLNSLGLERPGSGREDFDFGRKPALSMRSARGRLRDQPNERHESIR